jgi:hypothetical protein
MVGLLVGRNIAKGDRVVSRRLDAPARINARGVAVDEQAQHHAGVIGSRTGAAVLPKAAKAEQLRLSQLIGLRFRERSRYRPWQRRYSCAESIPD